MDQNDESTLDTAATSRAGKGWLPPEQRKKHLVGVPMNGKMLNALEKYRLTIGEDISRPEAIRSILNAFLKDRNFA